MSSLMANILPYPNLLANTSLVDWKQARQKLLCMMSQLLKLSPYIDENEAIADRGLLDDFCEQLLAYISTDYFATLGLADLPVNTKYIQQMLSSIKYILGFYDKYQDFKQCKLHARINDDLVLVSEELAQLLDLEELLIANFQLTL
jgi:regulator of sigma D